MSAPAPTSSSKFTRYRAKKKAEGKKLLRMWVPDLNAPAMREEIARQVALLRDTPGERETMEWLEVATSDLRLAPYDWSECGDTKPEA